MFFDELKGKFDVDILKMPFMGYFLGFNGVSLQGKVEIEYYSTVKIILKFGKQKIYIYGQNLTIKNLDKTEIVVLGDVVATSCKEVQIA